MGQDWTGYSRYTKWVKWGDCGYQYKSNNNFHRSANYFVGNYQSISIIFYVALPSLKVSFGPNYRTNAKTNKKTYSNSWFIGS